eukprot:TRINITY_DN70384_c0_g1_i1.p1 TRINITY_DN70384_c0_g1~~TRINITY_DN70384_c0_g1_i1.p1  ORF type:complete len:246 (-),score=18.66 TRINITY_DN70384_c0_g1_i1:113-850(-)
MTQYCGLCLFLVTCLVCGVSCVEFDFFLFVQQWPFGRSRPTCVEGFTIHGLWPNYANGGYPANCSGPAFDPENLNSIRAKLNCAWPSDSGTNNKFWKHEWDKHGTCAIAGDSRIRNELNYFSDVLKLYYAHNLTGAAVEAGLSASTRAVDKSTYIAKVKAQLGVTPILRCKSSTKVGIATKPIVNMNQRGLPLLGMQQQEAWYDDMDSVYVCVNKQLQTINCPASAKLQDTCTTSKIWFPKLPPT